MYAETLKLIASLPGRRPSPQLPERLHLLFRRLSDIGDAAARDAVEDEIWRLWMSHPEDAVAFDLERATRAMTAQDWGVADQILRGVVGAHPDYAEAWNKRATLYYIAGKDAECVPYIHRTLELEPRHYGALCGFAEILLGRGENDAALFVLERALRIHPHLDTARAAIGRLLTSRSSTLQ
jgi:tetratricopeptide (TPR) repeat protein